MGIHLVQKQQDGVLKAAAFLISDGRQPGKCLTDHQVRGCLVLDSQLCLQPNSLWPQAACCLWLCLHQDDQLAEYTGCSRLSLIRITINHLSPLTVTWRANHTVTSTSVSVTFPHDASTHSFLSLFPPSIYLAGQPACWDLPSIYIACQIKVYQCFPARRFCVLCWPASHTGCVRVPVWWLPQEAATSALQWVKQHLSALSGHRMDHYRLEAGTASFGVTSWAQRCILVQCGRARGAGQHLVAVATWLLGLELCLQSGAWWSYQLACG